MELRLKARFSAEIVYSIGFFFPPLKTNFECCAYVSLSKIIVNILSVCNDYQCVCFDASQTLKYVTFRNISFYKQGLVGRVRGQLCCPMKLLFQD